MALFGDMSEEGLPALGAEFFDDEETVILDEAIHAVTDRPVSFRLVEGAKDRLVEAGWPFGED